MKKITKWMVAKSWQKSLFFLVFFGCAKKQKNLPWKHITPRNLYPLPQKSTRYYLKKTLFEKIKRPDKKTRIIPPIPRKVFPLYPENHFLYTPKNLSLIPLYLEGVLDTPLYPLPQRGESWNPFSPYRIPYTPKRLYPEKILPLYPEKLLGKSQNR